MLACRISKILHDWPRIAHKIAGRSKTQKKELQWEFGTASKAQPLA